VPEKTVKDILTEKIAKTGENIQIRQVRPVSSWAPEAFAKSVAVSRLLRSSGAKRPFYAHEGHPPPGRRAAGFRNRCPNCGGPYPVPRRAPGSRSTRRAPDAGSGSSATRDFFLGSMSLNYGVTLVCFLTPVMLLAYQGMSSG
jgi:hypothetical protein